MFCVARVGDTHVAVRLRDFPRPALPLLPSVPLLDAESGLLLHLWPPIFGHRSPEVLQGRGHDIGELVEKKLSEPRTPVLFGTGRRGGGTRKDGCVCLQRGFSLEQQRACSTCRPPPPFPAQAEKQADGSARSLSPWLSQLPGLPTRRVKSSRAAVRGDELGGAGLAVRPAPYPSDHVPLAAEGGGLLAFSSPCQSLFPGALSMATEASGPRPGY